jgi:hypothetical protein
MDFTTQEMPQEGNTVYIDDWESDSSNARTGFLDINSLSLSCPSSPVLEPILESVVIDNAVPKRGNTIGARMLALKRFDDSVSLDKIKEETGVSRSSVYKLRTKAVSQGWREEDIVEPFHIDNAPRSRRPKTSTTTALFIVQTMTKNSTTRGWLCARIAAEVSNTPS